MNNFLGITKADMIFVAGLCTAITGITLLLLALVPAQAAMTTNPATVNATTWCALFNGTNSVAAEDVWFEYTDNTTNGYSFRTDNQSATGFFYENRCGMPLLPTRTYRVRAVSSNATGNNVTFSMPALTPNPTTTWEQSVDRFLSSDTNPKQMIVTIWTPYTAVMGGIFFGVLIAAIFWNMAIKQRTVALTVITMMVIGGTIYGLFPEFPEFVWLAQTLFIIALIGMVYWWWAKRRRG